jgi:hypothetical protein
MTTNTTTYGTVSSISEETVTLQVEEYVTRSRIPVRLNIVGELADGLYASTPSCDPAYVTVSGPKSMVDAIARLTAQYDLSMLKETGNERTAVPFQLVNARGEVIDNSLIEVTSESVLLDSVLVDQRVFSSKELVIDTTSLTVGLPEDGYVIVRGGASNNFYTSLLLMKISVQNAGRIAEISLEEPYAEAVIASPYLKKNTSVTIDIIMNATSWPSSGSADVVII